MSKQDEWKERKSTSISNRTIFFRDSIKSATEFGIYGGKQAILKKNDIEFGT